MVTSNQNIENNSLAIESDIEWLKHLIDVRLNNYFSINGINEFPDPPSLIKSESNYAEWIVNNQLTVFDRALIVCSLANIYCPEIFDKFLINNKGLNKRFTEFGGIHDLQQSRFIPTLETVSFILFGKKINSTFLWQSILDHDHILNKISAIHFNSDANSPLLSATFSIDEAILSLITTGKKFQPNYSSNFPAKILKTDLEWNELVLSPVIMDEVENIYTWINNKHKIINDEVLSKKLNKGYKCLFYGPPGTGKTLTATLLGLRSETAVYRVDLSQVVSKYVGETEKNLAKIFDVAENKDWILFFDEAESLFSKRTSVSDAKDKFANQQTAYLLQRIEDYSGLVILSTNLKPNIDTAFSRRIHSEIFFSIPSYIERKELWKKSLSGIIELDSSLINYLAKEFVLSGGSIKNVIQFSWLLSQRKKCKIGKSEIITAIRRELRKEGKSIED
tara:strand:+ start:2872 stop:4218 length:1347 start_codon:yes stop_codon:yes gene_type:complete